MMNGFQFFQTIRQVLPKGDPFYKNFQTTDPGQPQAATPNLKPAAYPCFIHTLSPQLPSPPRLFRPVTYHRDKY